MTITPNRQWALIIGPLFAVAMVAVVILFLIPNGRGGTLIDWESAEWVPWGILILFAAGIAIAQAFVESGLSRAIADQLAVLASLHPLVMITTIALIVTFLTETTSTGNMKARAGLALNFVGAVVITFVCYFLVA